MHEKCVFKKDDYQSSDGMLTYVWGPSLWHFLHTMSFNYPVKPTCDDKKNYMNYIKSLKHILPCRYCRDNLDRNLKETNFCMADMADRNSFSKFVFNLHNHINTMLGKKNTLTYEEVRERYENFRSRCAKKQKKVKKFKMLGADKKKLSSNNKKCIQDSKKELENGCVTPLQGIKSKCVIRIVPKTQKIETFYMDPKCRTKRLLKN
jgi:hypothetical protein